jgi:hypothetical protein
MTGTAARQVGQRRWSRTRMELPEPASEADRVIRSLGIERPSLGVVGHQPGPPCGPAPPEAVAADPINSGGRQDPPVDALLDDGGAVPLPLDRDRNAVGGTGHVVGD